LKARVCADLVELDTTTNSNVKRPKKCTATYAEVSESEDEYIVPYVDKNEEKRLRLKLDSKAIRYGVMCLFVNKYAGLEQDNEGTDVQSGWTGRGGLVSNIKRDLGISIHSNVKLIPIFMEIIECARTGKIFNANDLEMRKGHKDVIISIDSVEAQIVADCLESGLSVNKTRQIINEHMIENAKEGFSRSAVDALVLRMKPKIEKITKRKQGSRDPQAPWSQARFLWSKQLLIRLGELPSEENDPRFNQTSVGKLSLDQIVWWDETHRKCLVGGLSTNRDFTMKFPRDAEGKLNHINGNYSKKQTQILNCKYEKESRFGLGCAMVTPKTVFGEFLPSIGKRCKPFDYSEKVLLSVSDYDDRMAAEFRRVKTLTSRVGYWVEGTREKDALYLDDSLSKLKKVGKVTSKKLADNGFITVSDLKNIVDPDTIDIVGVSKPVFKRIWEQTQSAFDSNAPSPIDHGSAPNPYLSKFGTNWEQHLRKSSAFSSVIVVTEYIEHLMKESERAMKGTKHQDDWLVYHDSLSIMTASKTKEWMEDNGYLKRWILPSNDLYHDKPDLKKRFKNNPLGNSPEFMPWDTHLNQDVHASHDFHVAATSHLSEDHPNNFSGNTPKRLARSYKRILDDGPDGVAPTPGRIIQDVHRVVKSLKLVFDAKGVLINENITGRRYVRKDDDDVKANWGGSRKKKKITHTNILLHRDAETESKKKVTSSINKCLRRNMNPIYDNNDIQVNAIDDNNNCSDDDLSGNDI